jgi:hypothetical protein
MTICTSTSTREGFLRDGDIEEALGMRHLRSRPQRDHGKVFRIGELGIDRQSEQADQHLLLLNDHRHRRRQLGGAGAAAIPRPSIGYGAAAFAEDCGMLKRAFWSSLRAA